VGENGDFQPLHPKISRNSQTVSNAATVRLLLTINRKSHIVDLLYRFLRYSVYGGPYMDLHTVARLPLRQLGFLV